MSSTVKVWNITWRPKASPTHPVEVIAVVGDTILKVVDKYEKKHPDREVIGVACRGEYEEL